MWIVFYLYDDFSDVGLAPFFVATSREAALAWAQGNLQEKEEIAFASVRPGEWEDTYTAENKDTSPHPMTTYLIVHVQGDEQGEEQS